MLTLWRLWVSLWVSRGWGLGCFVSVIPPALPEVVRWLGLEGTQQPILGRKASRVWVWWDLEWVDGMARSAPYIYGSKVLIDGCAFLALHGHWYITLIANKNKIYRTITTCLILNIWESNKVAISRVQTLSQKSCHWLRTITLRFRTSAI